jgi:hypothetical protein
LLALLGVVVTQSGCLTMLAATACVAGQGSGCGEAVAAAATVDAVVLDATLHAAASAEEGEACADCCAIDEPCDEHGEW